MFGTIFSIAAILHISIGRAIINILYFIYSMSFNDFRLQR